MFLCVFGVEWIWVLSPIDCLWTIIWHCKYTLITPNNIFPLPHIPMHMFSCKLQSMHSLPVCYQWFFACSTPGITQVLVQTPPDCPSGHIPKEYRVLFLQLARGYSRTYLYLPLDNIQGPWQCFPGPPRVLLLEVHIPVRCVFKFLGPPLNSS